MSMYYYDRIEFHVENYITDSGETHKTISISVDDDEIVRGAKSLAEAIQMFDNNFETT